MKSIQRCSVQYTLSLHATLFHFQSRTAKTKYNFSKKSSKAKIPKHLSNNHFPPGLLFHCWKSFFIFLSVYEWIFLYFILFSIFFFCSDGKCNYSEFSLLSDVCGKWCVLFSHVYLLEMLDLVLQQFLFHCIVKMYMK